MVSLPSSKAICRRRSLPSKVFASCSPEVEADKEEFGFNPVGKKEYNFIQDIYGYVVEVSECPKCFEKSHHHIGDFHSYDIYKVFKSKGLTIK